MSQSGCIPKRTFQRHTGSTIPGLGQSHQCPGVQQVQSHYHGHNYERDRETDRADPATGYVVRSEIAERPGERDHHRPVSITPTRT